MLDLSSSLRLLSNNEEETAWRTPIVGEITPSISDPVRNILTPVLTVRYRPVLCWLAVLWLGVSASAQDTNKNGVPVLVRPGTEVESNLEELDPNDPLAKEKLRLRKWEEALNLTARSLADRQRSIAEREELVAERERQLAAREAALEVREAALKSREKLVAVRETMPEVKPWSGPDAPSIVGKHAMVIDARNGRILHQKAAQTEVPVASTQKLMTALLICEAGNLEQEVVIQASDTDVEPVILGFSPGDTYTRAELLKWLLVKSGNDVAIALARDNAGSVGAFAAKMNARAAALGMENTHFLNPNGLTLPGQHSTARDMALLAWEAYQQPFIRECVKMKSLSFELDNGTVRETTNTNRVLKEYEYCNGMKTGYTSASGYCLITSGEKLGRERIVVVLGSTGTWVWKDSQVLLEWALSSD